MAAKAQGRTNGSAIRTTTRYCQKKHKSVCPLVRSAFFVFVFVFFSVLRHSARLPFIIFLSLRFVFPSSSRHSLFVTLSHGTPHPCLRLSLQAAQSLRLRAVLSYG
jgi:hypothetical protein